MRLAVIALGTLLLSVPAAFGEPVDTTAWITLKADNVFTLRAPPGTVYREMDGIDSYVAGFDNPQFHIMFDYGMYANGLGGLSPEKGYRIEEIEIDDHKGRLITGPGANMWSCNDLVTAAYVDFGQRDVAWGGSRLEISGCTKSAAMLETLHAMFRSIRYTPH